MRFPVVALTIIAFSVLCLAQNQQPPSPNKVPTQQTSGNQVPPAAQRNVNGKAPQSPSVPGGAKPETGKAGEHATAVNDTTTQSTGVATPAYQTSNGEAQQPGNNTTSWNPPRNPQSGPGAPPNFEQAGQMQQHADINAAKAIEAEVGGAPGGGTYGINNVMPSYNTKDAGAQTRAAKQSSPTGTAAGALGEATKRSSAPKPSPTQPKTQE